MFFFFIALAGLVAQLVDGSLGMAYGVTSNSILVAVGLLPAVASASVHASEIVTTLVSGISHWRLGNIKKSLTLPLIFSGVAGGIIGAATSSLVSGNVIKPWVALILLAMGVLILCRFISQKDFSLAVQGKESKIELIVLGLIASFVDALGGGGWGPITTPSLILKGNHLPNEIIGSVNLSEFFVTIAMTATFIVLLGLDKFRWDIVIALIIGGALAAPLAASFTKKIKPRYLGILVGILLIITNLRTLILSF